LRTGQAGNAKNFITRTQAIRKLQISLPDFRKLCIWKGIYPREPRNKKKASATSNAATTFYYTKDIQYLLHEPLLAKFRDQKALEKKIAKALGRGDAHDASRLEKNAASSRSEKTGKSKYTLDHIIRERYPTFIDALRDLDDCLSMLFLFANLPSTSAVPAKMIARCEKLCLEFEHFLIVSHSLRKSFLSIKGIYYQATIQGQDILWLVPYKFNQRVTGDVDFRIMGTFVEFYQTLLGFVNYRLYTSLGLVYPPKFDANADNMGAELGAFTLEGNGVGPIAQPKFGLTSEEARNAKPDAKLQAEIDKLMAQLNVPEEKAKALAIENGTADEDMGDAEGNSEALDKFTPVAEGGDILPQPSTSAQEPSTLFSNFTFYLSRETPRQPLEFILKAFGCKRIGWDSVLGEGAFTHNELDPSITHQIVDRPPPQTDDAEDNQTSQKLVKGGRLPGRVYVQPQWVWDSVNDEELKPAHLYAPGAQLPPHLSPFVKPTRGAYDPSAPLAEQEREGEELEMSSGDEEEADEEEEEVEKVEVNEEDIDETAEGMDVAGSDEEEEEDEEEEVEAFGGFSDAEEDAESEDEATKATKQRQKELEAELTGKPLKAVKVDARAQAKADARKKAAKKRQEEEEELERGKMMLSRRKRKVLEKMVYSNKEKEKEAETLRAKRRKIEKSGKAAPRA
jgi:pescadillo protein